MRLADRRGLLTTPRPLSRIGELTLEILLVAGSHEKARGFVDQFRLAVISSDPSLTPKMFPEWNHAKSDEEIEEVLEHPAQVGGGPVEYVFEREMPPEEADAVLASLLTTQTMTGGDVPAVQAPDFPPEWEDW